MHHKTQGGWDGNKKKEEKIYNVKPLKYMMAHVQTERKNLTDQSTNTNKRICNYMYNIITRLHITVYVHKKTNNWNMYVMVPSHDKCTRENTILNS
jgi:hypothetical protein